MNRDLYHCCRRMHFNAGLHLATPRQSALFTIVTSHYCFLSVTINSGDPSASEFESLSAGLVPHLNFHCTA